MATHENIDQLSKSTQNMQRALVSLKEELEAIEWYAQRIDNCSDEELKKILIHNADEEKEHFAMILEWVRKNDPDFDGHLSKFLFKVGDITKD